MRPPNLRLTCEPRKKKGEGTYAVPSPVLPAFLTYQIRRKPNSKFRLPPSKLNLLRKLDEVTKI